MTIDLIQRGQNDTNDYESWLNFYGYTELEKDIKEDVIAVWQFFCTEELVLEGLKKFAEDYYLYNQIEHRSLRQFFDEWGRENHFNNPNPLNSVYEFETSPNFQFPSHTPFLYGELTADLFCNVLLKNGYLSADLGAGPIHGKWAHSIQFYLLEEARKAGLLKLHADSVCQFIQTISQVNAPNEAFCLWNILFDSFEESIFTYPNNITQFLLKGGDSEAGTFLAHKLESYKTKFDEAALKDSDYESYAKKKYLSRLNEASYVRYTDKCALLWFTPKDKNVDNVSKMLDSLSLSSSK